MSASRLVVAVCAVSILAACSIGEPIPQATTYIVEPAPRPPAATARRPDTLRMGYVRVADAFAGNALVYRMDDVQYVADPYAAFIAEPAAMLGERMAAWLDRAGPFKSVAQPGSAQSAKSAPFVLEATVTELYGDFRAGAAPAAVIAVQFALIDQTRPRAATVYERTIGRRVEIARAAPEALVRGYGKALAEILAQLGSDLRALPPG
jgi:uncharacterized lipoprotein YmbA